MLRYHFYKILRLFHLISKQKYKKRTSKYSEKYIAIARSKLFDGKWYLEHNPDVKASGIDPIVHYISHGWKEDRECTPYFDGDEYLKMNPDVAQAGMNPLVHWLLHGQYENRYAKTKPVKTHYFADFWEKIRAIAVYPITVYEECQRLELELKNLK